MHAMPSIVGYDVINILGQGSYSRVFKAKKHSTQQIVALKVLYSVNKSLDHYQRNVERFTRETQLCAGLQHPNIVRLADRGITDDGIPYAEYEYVPGQTLKEYIAEKGELSAEETGSLMAQLLDALSCAHAQGIVHRDLKPQNIIVNRTGSHTHIKVLDFGIGALIPEVSLHDYQNLTLTQEILCTPSYAAPEQLRGEAPTTKSDIYAWGLIFLECLLGEPVMKGFTMAEIYHEQLNAEEIAIPTGLAMHPLANVLRLALKKRADERAAQADILYAALKPLNLANIVGRLSERTTTRHQTQDSTIDAEGEATLAYTGVRENQRQITVLCCQLEMSHQFDTEANFELIDTLLADLLRQCEIIGQSHGGYRANLFCNALVLYFGYPYIDDHDCRRAARAALDIASKMQQAASHLTSLHQIKLVFGIGLHTGMVIIRKNMLPTGLTPLIANRLAQAANSIMVSKSARQLLQQYFLFDSSGAALDLNGQYQIAQYRLLGERDVEAMSIFQDIRRSNNPIVGRQHELQQLLASWQRAKNKQTCLSLIRGDAGIGKSRLMFEMRQQLHAKNAQIFEGRCTPENKNNALFPIFKVLCQILQLNPEHNPAASLHNLATALKKIGASLELTMPIFCSWLWLPLPEQYPAIFHSPQKQKEILLATLIKLYLYAEDDGPKLILIEDLHWADPTTLEFFNQLLQAEHVSPTCFTLTARPHFLHTWNQQQCAMLELGHLHADEAASLIADIIGEKQIDQQALQFLLKRIDGVPLFAEELIAMMQEKNMLIWQNNCLQLNPAIDTQSVPESLKDSLNHRLQNAGNALETAQFAAVLGREFTMRLLAELLLKTNDILLADLQQLIKQDLIYKKRNIEGDSFVFRHALIWDAAYESLRSSDRQSIHLRVASILENNAAETLHLHPSEKRALYQQIADHFSSAEQYDKAIEFGTQSSDISLAQFLIEETLEQGKKLQRWLAKTANAENNRDNSNNIAHIQQAQATNELTINRIMMQALMAKYGWADPSIGDYAVRSQALIQHNYTFAENDQSAWTMATAFSFYFVKSDRQGIVNIANMMTELAQTMQDDGMLAAGFLMHGFERQTAGNFLQAAINYEKAIQLYIPAEHQHLESLFGFDILAWTKAAYALICWPLGKTELAVQLADEAIAWSRARKHIPSTCIALLYRGILHQFAGNKADAKIVTDEILFISDKYGLPAYAAYAGLIPHWANDNHDLAASDAVAQVLSNMACRISLPFYTSLAADLVADSGDIQGAIGRIDACLELCKTCDDFTYEAELYYRRAEYHLRTGSADLSRVKNDIECGLALSRQRSLKACENWGENLLKNSVFQ